MRTLSLLFLFAYVYSIHIAPWIQKKFPKSQWNEMHEQCVSKTSIMPKWMLRGRGNSYIIGGSSASTGLRECTLTFWGMTHFLLYFVIGVQCPQYGLLANILGVLFELYEWKVYDCADPLDIVWNTTGFLIGRHWGRNV